jgi:hypothetical protein
MTIDIMILHSVNINKNNNNYNHHTSAILNFSFFCFDYHRYDSLLVFLFKKAVGATTAVETKKHTRIKKSPIEKKQSVSIGFFLKKRRRKKKEKRERTDFVLYILGVMYKKRDDII